MMMNGSRVNPNVKKDPFQDYDIVYVVMEMESFTSNYNWVDYFGRKIRRRLHSFPFDFLFLDQFVNIPRLCPIFTEICRLKAHSLNREMKDDFARLFLSRDC